MHRQDYDYTLTEDDGKVSSTGKVLKNLLLISVPVMLSSVALNLTSTIDTFTIINIIKRNSSLEAAEIAYGNYTTLAVTLFHLPSAFIYPISTSLAPALSAARASGNKIKERSVVNASMKMTVIISIPCAIGMAIMSKPILSLLFSNEASVSSAAPLLSILSPAIFFSAILTVTSAALQACHKQRKPIISMLCGITAKAIVSCALMSIKSIGILGAPIGTLVSYFVMATVNFIFVLKYVSTEINILRLIVKPIGASAISSVVTILSYSIISRAGHATVATVVSIVLTVAAYFVLLFALKNFEREDIMMLPKGEKIYNALVKLHLMK